MLRAGQVLQLTVVAMLGLAAVMIPSAGTAVGLPGHRSTTPSDLSAAEADQLSDPEILWGGGVLGAFQTLLPLNRHTLHAALALVAMALAGRINICCVLRRRGLASPVVWGVVVAVGLVALAMVPGVGKTVNGASRWLYLGPQAWGVSFQPSELVKWLMIPALGVWVARHRGVMHRFVYGLCPPLAMLALAGGLVMIEDLGTGVLIGLVGGCLLLAGGARLWQLGLIVPAAAGGVVMAILAYPYRWQRMITFLDPWADPLGRGYHPIQSMLTIAQGQLAGRGLGNGVQKFGYLPEDTTDFIFAVICEELGVAGAGLVVGLYVVLLIAGLMVLRDCKDLLARLVGLGVLLTVGFQALINMAVVTVLIPTKGIALPLISAGGTGWILTAAALGVVVSLDRANSLEEQPEAGPAPSCV